MAGGAVPLHPIDGWEEWNSIIADAKSSFLKTAAVASLLERYAPALRAQGLAVSHKAPVRPAGGSLFLIDKKSCRSFRKDGHNWVKGPDGKAPRERHVKLKVEGKEKINVYYAKEAAAESHPEGPLTRRCFWLLHPDKGRGQEGLVLVHYLRDKSAEPAGSDSSPQTSQSASVPRAHPGPFTQSLELPPAYHSWELAAAVPEMLPLQTSLLGNAHPREAGAAPFPSSKRAKPSMALEGDCCEGSFLGLLFEEESVLEMGQPTLPLAAAQGHSSALLPPLQARPEALPTPEWCCLPQLGDLLAEEGLGAEAGLEGSAQFVDPFPGEAFAPLSTPSSGSPEGIRSLDPLDRDFSDLEMLLAGSTEGDSLAFLNTSSIEELALEDLPLPQQAQQAQQEEALPEVAAQAAGLAFVVEDYVPKEDSAAGGAQMLITGELQPGASHLLRGQPLLVRFGSQQVPAELLRSGSVRCRVPPALLLGQTHQVPLFLALADGRPLSEARPFTYLAAPVAAPAAAQVAAEGSTSDAAAAAQSWQQPQQALLQEQQQQVLMQQPSFKVTGSERSMQGSTARAGGTAPQHAQRARAAGRTSATAAAADSLAFGAAGAFGAVPGRAANLGGGGRPWPSADAMAVPGPVPLSAPRPAPPLASAPAAGAAPTPQPAPRPAPAQQPTTALEAAPASISLAASPPAAAAPAGISLAAAPAASLPDDSAPVAPPAATSLAAAPAVARFGTSAQAAHTASAAPAAPVPAEPPQAAPALAPAPLFTAAPAPAAATAARSPLARAAAPGAFRAPAVAAVPAALPPPAPAPISALESAQPQPAKPAAASAAEAAAHSPSRSSAGGASGVAGAPLAALPPPPAPAKALRAAMLPSSSPPAAAQAMAATSSLASSSMGESRAGFAAPAEPSAPPGAAGGAGAPSSSHPHAAGAAAAATAAGPLGREGGRASSSRVRGSDDSARADREGGRVRSKEGDSGDIAEAAPALAAQEERQERAAAILGRDAPVAAGYRVPPSAKPAAGNAIAYIWSLTMLCLLLAWRCLLLGGRLALTAAMLAGMAAWHLSTLLSSYLRDRLATRRRPSIHTIVQTSQEGVETEGGIDPDHSPGLLLEPISEPTTAEQGLPGQPSPLIPSTAPVVTGPSEGPSSSSSSSSSAAPAQICHSLSSSSDGSGGAHGRTAPSGTYGSSLGSSSGGAGSSCQAAQELAVSFSTLQVSDTGVRGDSSRDDTSSGCSSHSSMSISGLAAPVVVPSSADSVLACEAAALSAPPATAATPTAGLSLGQLMGPAEAVVPTGSTAVDPGAPALGRAGEPSEADEPAEEPEAGGELASSTAVPPNQAPPSGDPATQGAAFSSSAGTSSALQPGAAAVERSPEGATSGGNGHHRMGPLGGGSADSLPPGAGPSR